VNITLIGYRGTGKSTVARLVAQRLGWQWIDADSRVEELAGRTIREIFQAEGESGFRDRESAVIRELTARDRQVIAAGGGAILRPENCQAIKSAGMVVWLFAAPDTIERRLAADPTTAARRPALTSSGGSEEIRRLLGEREPLYRSCADLIVETDQLSPEQIAERIVEAFRDRSPSPAME
jgi:shikimate kinase